MIRIAGNVIDPAAIASQFNLGGIEVKTIGIMSSSSEVYRYDSHEQLKFELDLRRSIIHAADELNRSRFSFRVFRKSMCNADYWHRTGEGGFLLESGVLPSDAINDIFKHSSRYGTECATAMVIVYYKALLDIFPVELFNRMFPEIYLMNWQHLDSDLGITQYGRVADFLPGDCMYFKNPDVNPETPEWQGENVINMGDGYYYGHGIGIRTGDGIIDALNKNRVEGSTVSAYLMSSAKRPNFKYLAHRYYSFTAAQQPA